VRPVETRTGPAEGREGRLVAQTFDVLAGGHEQCRGVPGADRDPVESDRRGLGDELRELLVEQLDVVVDSAIRRASARSAALAACSGCRSRRRSGRKRSHSLARARVPLRAVTDAAREGWEAVLRKSNRRSASGFGPSL
jgi:hypothetical protein